MIAINVCTHACSPEFYVIKQQMYVQYVEQSCSPGFDRGSLKSQGGPKPEVVQSGASPLTVLSI